VAHTRGGCSATDDTGFDDRDTQTSLRALACTGAAHDACTEDHHVERVRGALH
jgi:hypothetical protein